MSIKRYENLFSLAFFTLKFIFFWTFFSLLPIFSSEFQNISEENGIKSFAEGACWYQEASGGIKLANFNQGSSIYLGRYNFHQAFSEFERRVSEYDTTLKGRSVETFLHCGGFGAFLIFNLKGEDNRLCIWASVSSDATLSWGHMGYLKLNDQGFCHGLVPGVLIVFLKDEEDKINFLGDLRGEEELNSLVNKYRELGENKIILELRDDFRLRTKEVKDYLIEILLKNGVKAEIEEEQYFHPVGENRKLKIHFDLNF